MAVLSLVTLLAAALFAVNESSDIDGSLSQRLFHYQIQNQILHNLLARDCPSYSQLKRDIAESDLSTRLEVQKKVYEELIRLLITCRGVTKEIPGTKARRPTTTPSLIETTTEALDSKMCQFAIPQVSKCLWLGVMQKSWEDAKSDCIQRGGHLFTPKSDLENNWLVEQVVSTPSNQSFFGEVPADAWIGIRYIDGRYQWNAEMNTSNITVFHWHKGHLNPHPDCMYISRLNGGWDDHSPCFSRKNYICESPIPS